MHSVPLELTASWYLFIVTRVIYAENKGKMLTPIYIPLPKLLTRVKNIWLRYKHDHSNPVTEHLF